MSEREDEEREEAAGGGSGFVLALLGILFFPAVITGGLFYLLLRVARLRLSVIAGIVAVYELALLVAWGIADPVSSLMSGLALLPDLSAAATGVAPFLLMVSLILGGPAGLILAGIEVRQMRLSPHKLELPGTWMYQFRYRRTPLEVLRKKKVVADLKSGALITQKRSPLGISEGEQEIAVYRYEAEAFRHTLISGATGSGKTVTMQSLLYADIMNGTPTVLIDMKRSPEFASKLAKWTEEAGGSFYHFVNGDPENYDVPCSPGQSFYDPLKSGTPTAKADMVLGMREFPMVGEVYKQNLTQLLQVLFAMLKYANREHPGLFEYAFFDAAGRRIYSIDEFAKRTEIAAAVAAEWAEFQERKKFDKKLTWDPVGVYEAKGLLSRRKVSRIEWNSGGIYQLATAVRKDNLEALCKACDGTPVHKEASELAELLTSAGADGKGIKGAVSELQGMMRTVIASEYGKWLKTAEDGERSIDLFSLTRKPGSVVLFSLNSDSEPDFAKYIGSLIMADITNVSANRRNRQLKNPVKVYVDEFQVLNPTSVSGLLEKSRESRIAMTLAQQSFEQIVASSPSNGEAYLLSILNTCSNFIVHAGMEEDSAERLSKILGKEWVTEYRASNKHEGFFLSLNFSNRRKQTVQSSKEERWRFAPSRFMSLQLPDASNGFKSTAVVVNKMSADPALKGHTGAIAREVWMIPPSAVLEDYYVPPAEEGVRPSAAVSTDDEEYDEFAGMFDDDELDDDDSDDGDWGDLEWEETAPADDELAKSGQEEESVTAPVSEPVVVPEELPLPPAPIARVSSFERLRAQKKAAAAVKPVQRPPAPEPGDELPGLPDLASPSDDFELPAL